MAEGESGGLCWWGLGSTPALKPLCRGPARARVAEMTVPPGLSHGLVLVLESAAAIAVGPTTPASQEVLGSVFGL